MADQISYSDDSDKSEWDWDWDNDGEVESSSASALRSLDVPGPSTLVRQDADERGIGAAPSALVENFVGMGFPEELVLEAIKHLRGTDANESLSLLLAYQCVDEDATLGKGNCSTSCCAPPSIEEDDDDDFDIGNWDEEGNAGGREDDSDNSEDEGLLQEMSQKDDMITLLVNMGFREDEADLAISRCGLDADITVLVDWITASQVPEDGHCSDLETFGGRAELRKKRKLCGGRAQESRPSLDDCHDDRMPLPNPMVGFNLPNDRLRSVTRRLPEEAVGPPYFYFENVALAPKGEWARMSRCLYNIVPEFVDSKYMCAAA